MNETRVILIPEITRTEGLYESPWVMSRLRRWRKFFFQLLKPERIKKKIRGTREVACSGIFYYIEMFYDRKLCYRYNNMPPPKKMEKYKQ